MVAGHLKFSLEYGEMLELGFYNLKTTLHVVNQLRPVVASLSPVVSINLEYWDPKTRLCHYYVTA